MLLSVNHTKGAEVKAYVLAAILCAIMLSWFAAEVRAALPVPMPASLQPVDTVKYHPYSYIRFVKEGDCPEVSDEQFYDWAGKVIFPINKYTLPKRDSLLTQLKNEVFPLINADSLELVCVMIRGAASPEGPTKWNKFLGEHRAEALLKFVQEQMVVPTGDQFNMEVTIEDYRTLCILMRRRGDKDYGYVQAMCDQYLPKNQVAKLKATLRAARQGTLWLRLFREYFSVLRAARIILFFREPVVAEVDTVPVPPVVEVPPVPEVVDAPYVPTYTLVPVKVARRELLAVKSNLLFDFAYVPGYDRWCPIPNIALEYFPLHGHFTFGASLDMPWWQHYHDFKFFQIRNWQLETRYYFRSGDIASNPPGEGAAFRGFYLQGYVHAGVFGICFDRNRGWVGEGAGLGVGAGYMLPLSKDGHWRLEFGAQFGFFRAKYDPYQYENLINPEYHDDRYYYKWDGPASAFKRRQYRWNWFGPTRVGISISYDLLYRRVREPGISFKSTEMGVEVREGEGPQAP